MFMNPAELAQALRELVDDVDRLPSGVVADGWADASARFHVLTVGSRNPLVGQVGTLVERFHREASAVEANSTRFLELIETYIVAL